VGERGWERPGGDQPRPAGCCRGVSRAAEPGLGLCVCFRVLLLSALLLILILWVCCSGGFLAGVGFPDWRGVGLIRGCSFIVRGAVQAAEA